VHAEADHAEQHEREQRGARGERHACALAPPGRREHEEGEHEPGRELDAHAGRERARRRPRIGSHAPGAGAQKQRRRQREQQQRVVVRPADGEDQQHRVQAHERRRPARRLAEALGRSRDQRDCAEARDDGDRLERPQPAGESQRRGRVAEQREQWAVGRVLKRPADEAEDGVGRRFGCEVRIGIQAMQGSKARECQVAENVLGNQRWAQQQERVREHDRADERGHRQPACREQHEQVARAHDQHQRLKARALEADAQAAQRACHPRRPATAAARDVLRGGRGGAGAYQEDRSEDAEQPQRAERPHDARRHPRTCRHVLLIMRSPGDASAGYGGRGLYAGIVASPRRAGVQCAR
jgi:hypothetical protein